MTVQLNQPQLPACVSLSDAADVLDTKLPFKEVFDLFDGESARDSILVREPSRSFFGMRFLFLPSVVSDLAFGVLVAFDFFSVFFLADFGAVFCFFFGDSSAMSRRSLALDFRFADFGSALFFFELLACFGVEAVMRGGVLAFFDGGVPLAFTAGVVIRVGVRLRVDRTATTGKKGKNLSLEQS